MRNAACVRAPLQLLGVDAMPTYSDDEQDFSAHEGYEAER
jgi:hypothetical protein